MKECTRWTDQEGTRRPGDEKKHMNQLDQDMELTVDLKKRTGG